MGTSVKVPAGAGATAGARAGVGAAGATGGWHQKKKRRDQYYKIHLFYILL